MKTLKKLMAALLSVMIVAGMTVTSADAATISTETITPTTVQSIDNVQYPTTKSYGFYDGTHTAMKFVVTDPSVVEAYFVWDRDTVNTISGTVWFSTDYDGIQAVGGEYSIKSSQTRAYIFLDPGTYYLNTKFSIKNGKNSSYDWIHIALLTEEVRHTGSTYVTSKFSPLLLTEESPAYGFLSTMSPVDYYMFSVPAYGRVDIDYNFVSVCGASVGKGQCGLYTMNEQFITSKNFNTGSYTANRITVYLEAGTYVIKLSGCVAPTSLQYAFTDYTNIKMSATYNRSKTGVEEYAVKIAPEFEIAEAIMVNKFVPEKLKTDSTAFKNSVNLIDSIKDNVVNFSIYENGEYTVRIKSSDGAYRLFYVDADKIAGYPVIEGVKYHEVFKSGSTVKFTVDSDDLKSVTVNKKKVKPDENGIYTITGSGKKTIKATTNEGLVTSFYVKIAE